MAFKEIQIFNELLAITGLSRQVLSEKIKSMQMPMSSIREVFVTSGRFPNETDIYFIKSLGVEHWSKLYNMGFRLKNRLK